MTTDSIQFRSCHSVEEFRACVSLQKEVWHFSDAELMPLRMFVVADKAPLRSGPARPGGSERVLECCDHDLEHLTRA